MTGVAARDGAVRERPSRLPATVETNDQAPDVLFVMRSSDSLRFYQSSLELLIDRGHDVRLLLTRLGAGQGELAWLDRMAERPGFAYDVLDHFHGDPWYRRSFLLLRGIEYLRFLASGQEQSTIYFRKRWSRAPERIRRLAARPLLRTRRGLWGLHGTLSRIQRALPPPSAAVEYVERLRPGLLVLCDHMAIGSVLPTYARAAKERGIPVATCVASWDNLSSKQRTRVLPHALVVWNDRQLREAVEIHGVPAERVVVTGAPSFDKWFAWEPRERGAFLGRLGLDPARPVILWVGGSLAESECTEAEYVARWLAALRSATDPQLRDVGVLIRPHPYRMNEWLAVDFSGFENVAIWPRQGLQMPVGREQQADYYDSIFHSAAVIGLNTSAMIEAAIVGRPVLTILPAEFHSSQLGTFHFPYLLESSGGAVRVAHSLEEHFGQLGVILAGGDAEAVEQGRRFVADFVRPHGLERPATPIFVESLERLARTQVAPEREPFRLVALRRAIVIVYGLRDFVVQTPGRTRKRVRHFGVWLRAAIRVRVQRFRRGEAS